MTDKKTEALKLALEWHEWIHSGKSVGYAPCCSNDVMNSIREALAERPAQDNTYTCGVCGVSVQMEKPCELQVIAGRKVTIDWKTQALELRELVRLGGIKISELEAALSQSRSDDEQPAQQQEPYGWKVYGVNSLFMGEFAEADAKAEAKRIGGTCITFPLYTSQPASKPWVGLTDEEMLAVVHYSQIDNARAIEDKLKEKNGI